MQKKLTAAVLAAFLLAFAGTASAGCQKGVEENPAGWCFTR